jgi:antirestriction protein ArdC
MKTDIYQKITDQIVCELEKGVRPWLKPWNAEHAAGRITRPSRGNGIPYQGINVLMLWSAAMEKGYAAPVWMTFKQATELKANVRKGEHGSLVVYADKIVRTETDTSTGEEAERAIPFMKGYTVFNVEQIDGLPEHYYAKPAPRIDTIERIDRAEGFFAGTRAIIRHGGTMAYYNVTQDFVQLPPFESFRDAESYYATLAHETTHWTRHKSRLDRDLGLDRLGQQGTCPMTQDFGELIIDVSWLNQLDDVIFGHGISLLWWRSGGVKHPHDMPPFRFPPSPTLGDSSLARDR